MRITQFLYNLALTVAFSAIFSCSSRNSVNDNFEKKYASQVKMINEKLSQQSTISRNTNNLPSANSATQFPPDIFEIRYRTALHPPFRQSGVEFDSIEIPKYDAYGIASNLRHKEYILAGNDAIQRNLDKINASRNKEEIEFSDILIRENQALRREKKHNEIFGDDQLIAQQEQELSDDEKEKIAFLKEKRAKRNDPLRKMIAAQIIQQNLRTNGGVKQQGQGLNNTQKK